MIYSMILPICCKCMPKKWDKVDDEVSRAMIFIIKVKAMIRDGHRCRQCGAKKKLVGHHIKTRKEFPELRYDINNIITLCKDCERTLHSMQEIFGELLIHG